MLKKILRKLWIGAVFLIPCRLFSEGGKAEEALNKTVSTDHLTGYNYFLANAYNNNRILFALVSTGSIVILGIIITYLIGLILNPKHQLQKED
jgi:hypothetical protein